MINKEPTENPINQSNEHIKRKSEHHIKNKSNQRDKNESQEQIVHNEEEIPKIVKHPKKSEKKKEIKKYIESTDEENLPQEMLIKKNTKNDKKSKENKKIDKSKIEESEPIIEIKETRNLKVIEKKNSSSKKDTGDSNIPKIYESSRNEEKLNTKKSLKSTNSSKKSQKIKKSSKKLSIVKPDNEEEDESVEEKVEPVVTKPKRERLKFNDMKQKELEEEKIKEQKVEKTKEGKIKTNPIIQVTKMPSVETEVKAVFKKNIEENKEKNQNNTRKQNSMRVINNDEDDEEELKIRDEAEKLEKEIRQMEQKVVKNEAPLVQQLSFKDRIKAISKRKITFPEKLINKPPSPDDKKFKQRKSRIIIGGNNSFMSDEERFLEESYKKLVEDMQLAELAKSKEKEEIKEVVEEKKEIPVTVPQNVVKEDKFSPARIESFLRKLGRYYDLRTILNQFSKEDIQRLQFVTSMLQNFLDYDDAELLEGRLKESHFSPFVDFSESNLKRLYQCSHQLPGAAGQESREDWTVFIQRYMQMKEIENKNESEISFMEGKIEDHLIDDQIELEEKSPPKDPKEFFQKSLRCLENGLIDYINNLDNSATGIKSIRLMNTKIKSSNEFGYKKKYGEDLKLPDIKLKGKYRVDLTVLENRNQLAPWEITERRCKIMGGEYA